MDFSRKWMSRGMGQCRQSHGEQTLEYPLRVDAAESRRVEMALEELHDADMGGDDNLCDPLPSQDRILVRRERFGLCHERVGPPVQLLET